MNVTGEPNVTLSPVMSATAAMPEKLAPWSRHAMLQDSRNYARAFSGAALSESKVGASAIKCYSGRQKLVHDRGGRQPARHGARDRADAY